MIHFQNLIRYTYSIYVHTPRKLSSPYIQPMHSVPFLPSLTPLSLPLAPRLPYVHTHTPPLKIKQRKDTHVSSPKRQRETSTEKKTWNYYNAKVSLQPSHCFSSPLLFSPLMPTPLPLPLSQPPQKKRDFIDKLRQSICDWLLPCRMVI